MSKSTRLGHEIEYNILLFVQNYYRWEKAMSLVSCNITQFKVLLEVFTFVTLQYLYVTLHWRQINMNKTLQKFPMGLGTLLSFAQPLVSRQSVTI